MRSAIAALFLVSLVACASNEKPTLTPLELQSLQTREFEAEKEMAFASVLSVFADLGYIIESADKDTGFITARSSAETSRDWLFTGSNYVTQTRATAFVEPMIAGSRVRLNFVTSTEGSNWRGQKSVDDTPIIHAQTYQAAFEKIENAIFIRQGTS